MEATPANVSSGCVNYAASVGYNNQFAATSAPVHLTNMTITPPYYGLRAVYPPNTAPANASGNQIQNSVEYSGSRVQAPAPAAGVSNCYVFKSQLQEYAQKVGLTTPTYETLREGPSHAPFFRSTVIVGGARYDSLLGFPNRKGAEQSAAEVALMALSAIGEKKESITVPVHETGLCKNVLQEYAQKMNYAIPTYVCTKEDSTSSRMSLYSCTVDIGGIQYIGAAARTKKEAEIKAARTALLAIRSSGDVRDEVGSQINYTVLPGKRKVPDSAPSKEETSKPKKSKKSRVKKKKLRKCNQIQAVNVQVAGNGQSVQYPENSAQEVNGATNVIGSGTTVVSGTDANSYNGIADIPPMINASMSSQSNTLVPENPVFGVDQRGEVPKLTDQNHANEEKNTQASEQLDAVNSDSRVLPEATVHGQVDATNVPLARSDQTVENPDADAQG